MVAMNRAPSSHATPVATSPATYADGVIKPNMGIDYAPTDLWTSLLGQPIPDSG